MGKILTCSQCGKEFTEDSLEAIFIETSGVCTWCEMEKED